MTAIQDLRLAQALRLSVTACLGNTMEAAAYRDSCSPWTIIHEGQLAKGPNIPVCAQQLGGVSTALGGFELPSLNYVEIVPFLSFPTLTICCEQ